MKSETSYPVKNKPVITQLKKFTRENDVMVYLIYLKSLSYNCGNFCFPIISFSFTDDSLPMNNF